MVTYSTAQMQVNTCELKTCECKETLYEKIAFEFQAIQNRLHKGHSTQVGIRAMDTCSMDTCSMDTHDEHSHGQQECRCLPVHALM